MKTADEMFRELGYEKVDNKTYCTKSWGSFKGPWVKIRIRTGMVEKYKVGPKGGRYIMAFTPQEIRAVCKLLDEMGVE